MRRLRDELPSVARAVAGYLPAGHGLNNAPLPSIATNPQAWLDRGGFDGLGAADWSISIAATDDLDTVDRADDVIAEYSSRGPRKDDGDDVRGDPNISRLEQDLAGGQRVSGQPAADQRVVASFQRGAAG